ncbi:unnamed protein product [Durusdinium trenchii]|uniref:Uncharacterized protein n=1 Tax=Durusdinium trenchii TaxID=1381693 RepID=A0ABP0L5S3_9DINO
MVDADFRPLEVEVELWEVGGTKTYSCARPVFYDALDAVLLVYDMSNMKSYHGLVAWLFELCSLVRPPSLKYWDAGGGSGGQPDMDLELGDSRSSEQGILGGRCPVLFVANKCDLQDQQQRENFARNKPRPIPPERPPLVDRLLGGGTGDAFLQPYRRSTAEQQLLEKLCLLQAQWDIGDSIGALLSTVRILALQQELAMAAMGVAAAVAAGGAIGIIAYQTSCGCYPSSASRVVSVPVKKRSSTTTSLMGEVLCQLPGMLGRTRRHVTLVGDMLMHGSVAGQAEGSIFLRGAEVCKHGKELHVIKDAELAIAIYFDDEEEADFWAKGLSSAVKVSDSLPKLFSMHAREMSKRSEEANASAANAISKLLSLKRRELTEVERKAHNYELVADQKQQEVQELQERLAAQAALASQKEEEMERLRQEVEAEKNKVDRMELDTTAASAPADESSRAENDEKEKCHRYHQRAHFEKSQKMEEVQKRLLAMQKLLEQSEAPGVRKPRRSTPASFPSQ